MRKVFFFVFALFLLFNVKAQTDSFEFDITGIECFDQRIHLLYSLSLDERFDVSIGGKDGIFVINPGNNSWLFFEHPSRNIKPQIMLNMVTKRFDIALFQAILQQSHSFVDAGCVFTACRGEGLLSAAAALNLFGCRAHDGGGVHVLAVDQALRQHHA